jgi:hypothetical protein
MDSTESKEPALNADTTLDYLETVTKELLHR